MKRRATVALVAAAALLAPLVIASPAGASGVPQPITEVVVRLASGGVHPASVLGSLPGEGVSALRADRYALRVPAGEVAGVLATLRADPRVAYAEVPQKVHATATPNDPCYTTGCGPYGPTVTNSSGFPVGPVRQDNLTTVHAQAAWALTQGDPSVTVAVIDSGVDASHPDLAGKVIVGPNECINDEPGCAGNGDGLGHGTHVTGTIAAATNNGQGVASLGWNTRVEMFKVLDSGGNGNTADLANAIYDAMNSGAQVINMSLGNDSCDVTPSDCGPDQDTQAAVAAAISRGVVVVAAAGNDGSNQPTYPADYPGVLAVGATDNHGILQGFSQYGSASNIAAPGVDVLSTWNDGDYAVLSGTSMSAPHVAAAAALVVAANPSLSGWQVASVLQTTAGPLAGGHAISGGLLDAGAAVRQAMAMGVSAAGYVMAGSDGTVYGFGAGRFHGDLAGVHLNAPVVGVSAERSGLGYWLGASDGGVFNFGNAAFLGSTGNLRLNKPVVGIAAKPDGTGYWLVASDGGVFNFGSAPFLGSTGSMRLNQPIVGMAATPDGRGYWLVAADGGIFNFGDAPFLGSTGSMRLNQPIVGMAATPDGRGYWLVAADGGIFNFSTAGFFGSTGSLRLNKPIVGMTPTPTGRGYWLAASDGGVFNLGDAAFLGSAGGQQIPAPVVGVSI